MTQPAPQPSGLPITLSLDKPGYVTAVIERADGRRVGTRTFTSEPGATYTIFGSSNLRSSSEASWTEIESNSNSGGQTTTKDFIDFDVLGRQRDSIALARFPEPLGFRSLASIPRRQPKLTVTRAAGEEDL